MSIKCIIFDLDGVLISSKQIHFEAFNYALKDYGFELTLEEHLKDFDGLSTKEKINKLSDQRRIGPSIDNKKDFQPALFQHKKQKKTFELLRDYVEKDEKLLSIFSYLKDTKNLKIFIATNSIRRTTHLILSQLGILEYIDGFICNEDIKNAKPHPEMYLTCMVKASVRPSETLIVEDSPFGLEAARDSGAKVCAVRNPDDVTLDRIKQLLEDSEVKVTTKKFMGRKINIIIPAAGLGSRFEKAGFSFPKPLIEVWPNKPMIQVVTESLNIEGRYIFIIQKLHSEKYNFKQMLKVMHPTCEVIEVDGVTDGAARTVLMAKEFVDNDEEVIVANSDQFIEWDSNDFLYQMNYKNAYAGILTFESNHPKWSFVRKNELNEVIEVAEKKPISNEATIGVYWFRFGRSMIWAIEKMIEKDIRTNGEFYFAPCLNELIGQNCKVLTYNCPINFGLGTPEDLKYFQDNYKK